MDGTICSVSGQPCQCSHARACRSRLDARSIEALSWARSSVIKLEAAVADLDLALDKLIFERPFPSPEWRDAKRRIEAVIKDLETVNKG